MWGNLLKITITIFILSLAMPLVSTAALKDDLFAYPNPFLPTGQPVTFHYTLANTGLMSIDVYDSRGVHIRKIAKMISKTASAHKGEEFWDGKNDKGEYVPAGVYAIRFDITYSGGASERATILVGLVR
jgi:hypothetical protein